MNAFQTDDPRREGHSLPIFTGLMVFLLQLTEAVGQPGGAVIGWGNNDAAQCSAPPGLTDAIAVAAGESHSLALKSDGTVVGWGFNLFGQVTPPSGLANVKAIAAGPTYSLAVKADGSVVCWGSHSLAPAGLTNVVAVAAGYDHSLALKRDGTVVAWGSDTSVPAGLTNVVAVAAGTGHSLALLGDGTVVAWGDDSFFKTQVPAGLSNVVAIAAGQDHCLALVSDGTVVGWGANYTGQAAVPADLTNVLRIAAGTAHNLALRTDGTLIAWGENSYGQAQVNSSVPDHFGIAAGMWHSLALKNDGRPAILDSPSSQTVLAGQDLVLEVLAMGRAPLSYQWRCEGTNLPAAVMPVLVLTNLQPAQGGTYSVVVANSVGSSASPAFVLTVLPSPPVLTRQPESQVALCGATAIFQVAGYGSTPLSCQWFFEGTAIDGATNLALVLTNAGPGNAGTYWLAVTNDHGTCLSQSADLQVTREPSRITSALTAFGRQGYDFAYTITASNSPTLFAASGLPGGLSLDPFTGVISGIPLEAGAFAPTLSSRNQCGWDSESLLLTIGSTVPGVYGWWPLEGVEGENLEYEIPGYYYTTYPPEWVGAENLPPGLSIHLGGYVGLISGTPMIAGEYDATVYVGNQWGTNSALLHCSITNAALAGLSMTDVSCQYYAPYLVEYQFSLRDSDDPEQGAPLVVNPAHLRASCLEDGVAISPVETGYILERGSTKVQKAYLVLDFTESIASLSNGDSNGDGISDAVDFLVGGAQEFVRQQDSNCQVGVYEFHREDWAPEKVIGLTTDKAAVQQAIAGIWAHHVRNFPASSRCWDALAAALEDLGPAVPDEQHLVLCVSDGNDESSHATLYDVIDSAISNNVKICCVGFGASLNPQPLYELTSATGGKYLTAETTEELASQFVLMSKEGKGQYVLRWATLKRSGSFVPAFRISFQSYSAASPADVVTLDTNAPPIIDTNTVPPTTNYPYTTNYTFEPYEPAEYAGDVTAGTLRLVADAEIRPPSVTLRASYVPRHIHQIRLHYRPNWPCTVTLLSTGAGEILMGWSLSQTNDGAGGRFLLLSGPQPPNLTNSLRFGAMGNLLKFTFRDLQDASNAFSFLEVDNTLYAESGGQSFQFPPDNLAAFVTPYPALPKGTPVPWLMAHGFASQFETAELTDPDGDGAPMWREFLANTDPFDRASNFMVHDVWRLPNDRFQIRFSTALNRTYQLESSTNLIHWQTNLTKIPGTGFDHTVTDLSAHPGFQQIFYRVSVQ